MRIAILLLLLALPFYSGCKTQGEVRQELELEKMRQNFREVQSDKADMEAVQEEYRTDLARMGAMLEGQAQAQKRQFEELRRYNEEQRKLMEELKKENQVLAGRLATLEQRFIDEEAAQAKQAQERSRLGLDTVRKLIADGEHEEAIEMLRTLKGKLKGEDAKKAQFLLGESYYNHKEYASAVLEFSEFRKRYGSDSMVPNAIYHQGMAFKNMAKSKEARLFFEELIERYPKHPLAAKVQAELKKPAKKGNPEKKQKKS